MFFEDKQIMYSILETSKLEIVNGMDKELEKYIRLYDRDISEPIVINKYVKLGFLALSLLDNKEVRFNEDIQKKIEILRFYIEKCIKDKSFCKNNIFLAYVRENLNLLIPSPTIYTNYRYEKNKINENIESADINEKLNIMLFDSSKIELKKDYICSGIIELLICSLYEIFNNGFHIKRCENCKRYFVSQIDKKNIKYCSYLLPGLDVTCRDIMNKANYIEKRRNDVLQSEYNSLYSKYNNWYIRTSEKIKVENINSVEVEKNKKIREEFKKLYKNIKNEVKINNLDEKVAIQKLKEYDKEVSNGSKRTHKK